MSEFRTLIEVLKRLDIKYTLEASGKYLVVVIDSVAIKFYKSDCVSIDKRGK